MTLMASIPRPAARPTVAESLAMAAPPRVSIVVPTYNTAAMTLECCRAASSALPHAGELIVVDDASTDGTAVLLDRELPLTRMVRRETRGGFSAAVNSGVAVASGELILLLNSDAILSAEALQALMAAFAEDAGLGVAGARLLNPDGTAQWSGGRLPTLPWLFVLASGVAHVLPRRPTRVQRSVEWVSGAAMAFRREVWELAGPLRETFRFYAQDVEFCARAVDAGWKVRIVENAPVVHALGGSVRAGLAGALTHDPTTLWLDLLAWGRLRHGPFWSANARVMMIAAGSIRVAVRRLREPFLRGRAREDARAVTSAYCAAVRQLFVER